MVYQGDSITEGYGATLNQTFPQQMLAQMTVPLKTYDYGAFGQTVNQQAAAYPQFIRPLVNRGVKNNVLHLWIGTNDIAGGQSGEVTFQQLIPFINMAQADGWKVVVGTMLPRGTSINAQRMIYNNLIRKYSGQRNYVVADYAADPTIGQVGQNGAPYYLDGIHPTSLGYTYIAQIAETAIASVLQ
jgi:lysophospholipase L1-like esterase